VNQFYFIDANGLKAIQTYFHTNTQQPYRGVFGYV
jgi:hypothetical protein